MDIKYHALGYAPRMTPQKGGFTTPAPALDLTTSLRGDFEVTLSTTPLCLTSAAVFDSSIISKKKRVGKSREQERGGGGRRCKVQGPPNERGAQIDNAPFTMFNYTLEGEEGGGVKGGGGGVQGGLP